MGKIYFKTGSKCSHSSIGRIKQGICGDIIHRSDPFALKDTPQSLSYIKIRTIWEKEEEEQPAFLPYGTQVFNEPTSIHVSVVNHYKCVPMDIQRQTVKKISYSFSRHVLCCGETMIDIKCNYVIL